MHLGDPSLAEKNRLYESSQCLIQPRLVPGKEVGNNPIHRMAHKRKKFRWFVENSSDIEGKMRADHATNRMLPFDRQLMDFSATFAVDRTRSAVPGILR
ncbi:MAG: hypothetical protein WBD78_05285 [Methylocella sp.]